MYLQLTAFCVAITASTDRLEIATAFLPPYLRGDPDHLRLRSTCRSRPTGRSVSLVKTARSVWPHKVVSCFLVCSVYTTEGNMHGLDSVAKYMMVDCRCERLYRIIRI